MAKSKKNRADARLALNVFEQFPVTSIEANVPLTDQLPIEEDHPLYVQLKDKSLSQSYQREEFASILDKRKNRRPKKLARKELEGKQGFLLKQTEIENALKILELCPEINLIPSQKPLSEILSKEALANIPANLHNVIFNRNIVKDNAGNVYIISESALGKGAFGEVLIAQAIKVSPDTKGLNVGSYVAVKQQVLSEDTPIEDMEQEFAFEKKMPEYHFGSTTSGENVYSFVKMIRGSELGEWFEKSVFKIEQQPVNQVALPEYEQAFLESLFDPEHYEILRLTEEQGLKDLAEFEEKINKLQQEVKQINEEYSNIQKKVKDFTEELNKDKEEKGLSKEEIEEQVEKMEIDLLTSFAEELAANGLINQESLSEQSEKLNELEDEFKSLLTKQHSALSQFPNIPHSEYPQYQSLTVLDDKILKVRQQLLNNLGSATGLGASIDRKLNPSGTFKQDRLPEDFEVPFKDTKTKADKIAENEVETVNDVHVLNDVFPKDVNFETVLQLALTTAERIQALHEQGVLHRDIKPANLLIDTTTEDVTVIDFGVAKLLDEDKKVVTGVGGTPDYWAPEIYRNIQSYEILQTPATDIWSLGATFQVFVNPLLEKIVDPESIESLTYMVTEGSNTTERMLNLQFANPNNDPMINALNRYFEIIANMKKIQQTDRKDMGYVISELKNALIQLKTEKQRQDDLYNVLNEALSKGTFKDEVQQIAVAKNAISNWKSQHPEKPDFNATDSEIKFYIATITKQQKAIKEERSQARAARIIFTNRPAQEYQHNQNALQDLAKEIAEMKEAKENIPHQIEALTSQIDIIVENEKETTKQKKSLETQLKEAKKSTPEQVEGLSLQISDITKAAKKDKEKKDALQTQIKNLKKDLSTIERSLPNAEHRLLELQKAIARYENRNVSAPDEPAVTATQKREEVTTEREDEPTTKRKNAPEKQKKTASRKEESTTKKPRAEREDQPVISVGTSERVPPIINAIPITPAVTTPPETKRKPEKSPEQLALLSWFQNQDIQKLYSSQKVSKRIPFANLSIFQLDARKDQIKNLQNIVNNVAEMLNKDVHSPEALSSVMEGFLEEVRKMHQQVANEKNSRMLGDSKMEKMLENMKTEVQDIVKDLGKLNQPKKDTPYSP